MFALISCHISPATLRTPLGWRSATGQVASAHTVRPPRPSRTPHLLLHPATSASPRPSSARVPTDATAGAVAAPPSVTDTKAMPSRGRRTSTANVPPRPDAVCSIALAASSDTQVSSVSRAGHPARADATNSLASLTCPRSPGNDRICRVRPRAARYGAVTLITPRHLQSAFPTIGDGKRVHIIRAITFCYRSRSSCQPNAPGVPPVFLPRKQGFVKVGVTACE